MKFKPIQAQRFDEIRYYRSVRACAKELGVVPARATRAVKYEIPINGWTIKEYEGDPETIKGLGMPEADKVIATTQNGIHVIFKDIEDASYRLKCSKSSLTLVLKGKRPTLGGWKWHYDDGSITDAVPYDDKIGCMFEICGHTSCKERSSKTQVIDDDDEEEENPDKYCGRDILATGFYDPEYSPTICPICQKIICSDTKHDDIKGSRHLTKCLSGYDYSIKNGLITVYKPL